ncbi:MAG: NAD kinase [Paenibacillaceae bacterium]|nr:NAD kinase [Paenibacillaceae bacterium]
MKFFVVDRGDETSIQLADKFRKLAQQFGMILDEVAPELVVSIGGDGTMLHAFHMFKDRADNIAFVGVHTGRLGFFADWMPHELEQLMVLIHAPEETSTRRLVHYPLIDIEIVTDLGTEQHTALNEFTIKGITETLVVQLNINDDIFEVFRGDGIVISTPSGSTAYNKSLGGALLHPSVEAIQIAEIASINNRVYRTLGSSMVLPKHHHCDIIPQRKNRLLLAIDHINEMREDIVSIRCKVSSRKIAFARYRPFPFWRRVREAFIDLDVQQ